MPSQLSVWLLRWEAAGLARCVAALRQRPRPHKQVQPLALEGRTLGPQGSPGQGHGSPEGWSGLAASAAIGTEGPGCWPQRGPDPSGLGSRGVALTSAPCLEPCWRGPSGTGQVRQAANARSYGPGLFSLLLERQTYREERQIFHPLAHSPNGGCNSICWTNLNPEARSPHWFSYMSSGSKPLGHLPLLS